MEYDLHDLAYKSYMEDAENHFQNRDTYITGFKAGYQKAIQVQAGVIKKNAEFTAEELYAKLDELIDKHPSTFCGFVSVCPCTKFKVYHKC